MPGQANRRRDVIKLRAADLLQRLAPGFEILVDFDGFLRHRLVGLLGAAHQREIGPGGHALVTIVVEANAEEHRLAFLRFTRRLRHAFRLSRSPSKSMQDSSRLQDKMLPKRNNVRDKLSLSP